MLVQTTPHLVGANELARMKPTSWLVNTSRGPIVDETALIEALKGKQLADAALDVLDIEPLPKNDPFRTLGTVMATPHLGYVSRQQYETWYGDTAAGVSEWLDAHAPAAPTTPTILVAE